VYLLFTGLGRQENGHHTALQLCALVQIGNFGALFGKLIQQILADVGVGHLTAAETNGNLHAVAVGNELLSVLQLGVEVAHVDTGRHPDLLDLHHVLVLSGFLLALALLETELSVVHQLAHRGIRLGRDLDQIQTLLISDLQSLSGSHDAQLLALGADQSHLFVANVLIQFMHLLANGESTSIHKSKNADTVFWHPRNNKLPPIGS